jgi:hypothetical protein
MSHHESKARRGHAFRRRSCAYVAALLCVAAGYATVASDSLAAGHRLEGRQRSGGAKATAARVIELKETGLLHLTSGEGTTLFEHGHANGTFNCSIVVHLTIVSASRVATTFTVDPRGGSISGKGSARYAAEGGNGYFGGTIALTRGTGSYARAWGNEIGISGKIDRESLKLTVHVHGAIRL